MPMARESIKKTMLTTCSFSISQWVWFHDSSSGCLRIIEDPKDIFVFVGYVPISIYCISNLNMFLKTNGSMGPHSSSQQWWQQHKAHHINFRKLHCALIRRLIKKANSMFILLWTEFLPQGPLKHTLRIAILKE